MLVHCSGFWAAYCIHLFGNYGHGKIKKSILLSIKLFSRNEMETIRIRKAVTYFCPLIIDSFYRQMVDVLHITSISATMHISRVAWWCSGWQGCLTAKRFQVCLFCVKFACSSRVSSRCSGFLPQSKDFVQILLNCPQI